MGPSMQVQAPNIERQLCAKHLKEAPNVLRRLSRRVGDEVDPAVPQFRQHHEAAFVSRVELESKGRRTCRERPGHPVALRWVVFAEHVIHSPVPLAQLGAEQNAVLELHLP